MSRTTPMVPQPPPFRSPPAPPRRMGGLVLLALSSFHVLAILVVMVWVAPKYFAVFASVGTDLPRLSVLCLKVSLFLRTNWPVVVPLGAAAVVVPPLLPFLRPGRANVVIGHVLFWSTGLAVLLLAAAILWPYAQLIKVMTQ
jgi:type II secretory pathway component PulF